MRTSPAATNVLTWYATFCALSLPLVRLSSADVGTPACLERAVASSTARPSDPVFIDQTRSSPRPSARSRAGTRATTRTFFVSAESLDLRRGDDGIVILFFSARRVGSGAGSGGAGRGAHLSDGSSSFIARFSISFSSISFHIDVLVSLSISS